jgi:8-oxo-dGTP diphosphatase
MPNEPTGYTYAYPRPAVTVDILLFAPLYEGWSVLLIQRLGEPFAGHWALPGGFVEMEEDLESAASRELWEETGVNDIPLHQLHTFGAPGRDPRGRVISVCYTARLNLAQLARMRLRSGDDAAAARWWSLAQLPAQLAFDHAEIIRFARQRFSL